LPRLILHISMAKRKLFLSYPIHCAEVRISPVKV
jgi:hypothetical protein